MLKIKIIQGSQEKKTVNNRRVQTKQIIKYQKQLYANTFFKEDKLISWKIKLTSIDTSRKRRSEYSYA